MDEKEVIKILIEKLNFNENSIIKLQKFTKYLLIANKKHNLIAKSTERHVWLRHILDSAQLVKFIDFKKSSISDLGSGAGFPGIVLAIFNDKINFHVKLYEKSPVKRYFLNKTANDLNLNVSIKGNINEEKMDSSIFVCRAFKKLEKIIDISREKILKPHKIIVLKGQNAENEINKVPLEKNYRYKIVKSMTDHDSKIVIIEAN